MSNDLSTYVCQFTPAIQDGVATAVAAAYMLPDIVDAATCEQAVAVNARLAKSIKAVAEERLEFTRKLDAVKKRAMGFENQVIKEAVECISAIDSGINDFRAILAREAARRENEARIAQQAQAAKEEEAGEEYMTAPLVAVEPMVEMPKIPTRKVAKVLITDIAKIPRAFFVLDESAVLTSLKSGIEVPGAELVYEEVLVRR